MNLSTQWQSFITFPLDPDRVLSRGVRLDLSLTSDGGRVVAEKDVVWSGDEFEAMRISEQGRVMIWTKKRVWVLRQEHGMEKLMFLPRHPHEEWKDD